MAEIPGGPTLFQRSNINWSGELTDVTFSYLTIQGEKNRDKDSLDFFFRKIDFFPSLIIKV